MLKAKRRSTLHNISNQDQDRYQAHEEILTHISSTRQRFPFTSASKRNRRKLLCKKEIGKPPKNPRNPLKNSTGVVRRSKLDSSIGKIIPNCKNAYWMRKISLI